MVFNKAVSKKKTGNVMQINTLIGEGTKFEGNLHINGTLKIDGELIGDITSSGDVIIGETSYITGNIYCKNILISGAVTGNIHAENQLSLSSTATTKGELKAESLIIEEGAEFIGNCQTVGKHE